MAFQHYRASSLGAALEDTLDEMVDAQTLSTSRKGEKGGAHIAATRADSRAPPPVPASFRAVWRQNDLAIVSTMTDYPSPH